jgi:hypothetical protein
MNIKTSQDYTSVISEVTIQEQVWIENLTSEALLYEYARAIRVGEDSNARFTALRTELEHRLNRYGYE